MRGLTVNSGCFPSYKQVLKWTNSTNSRDGGYCALFRTFLGTIIIQAITWLFKFWFWFWGMFCWFPNLHGSACGFSNGDLGPLFIIEYWFWPGGGRWGFIDRCHPSNCPGLFGKGKNNKFNNSKWFLMCTRKLEINEKPSRYSKKGPNHATFSYIL